ncbi:TonB-dependent receptor [Tsuneonella flava]|uniref:TonB-dependent receptor n=1 Tax=Tsuneonella flava TaxID=2055955 RepID=A0ABX7KAJ2_9SPHN|nr:TonB-dependent receptor [Tsuneonella flava]QSB44547.1 TonB-dependent receptor [Tsuneonella flava]
MNNSRISAWSRKGHLFAGAGIAAISLVALSAPAYAQDTQDTSASDTGSDRDVSAQADSGDAIIVTGSRIRKDKFNADEPLAVLTRAEMTQQGFNSTTDALQSNAVTGGTAQINNYYGGFVTDGGTGANTVGLRGLGASRTLLLLNGRRLAPGGTRGSVLAADLNVLPTAIVDRIEVLKSGASSIYGSDAVAGVINIITDNKVRGLHIDAQTNVPEVGAGVDYRISGTFGFQADRLNVVGSVEYRKRNMLTRADQPWFNCPIGGALDGEGTAFGSGDYIDPTTGKPKCFTLDNGGVTINTIGVSSRNSPDRLTGVVGKYTRLVPDASNTGPFTPGYSGVDYYTRDTYDPDNEKEPLVTPVEIYTGYLSGTYQLDGLGNAEIYAELLATRRKSSSPLYRQLSIDYAEGSPLLPAQFQDSVIAYPNSTTNGEYLGVRAFVGYGLTDSTQQVDYVRASGGIRGDFFLPEWRYDAYVGKSWNDGTYTAESFLTDRLANAMDVVANGDGTFSCRVSDPNCVAAPVLTPSVVNGNLPQAYRDYITENVTGTTKFRETTVAFNIDGPLMDLPGGKAQLALGAEYRKQKIDDTPDQNAINGNLYGLTAGVPTRGTDAVKEVFGELYLPLLSDVPFFHRLSLDGSVRFTDYDSYGSDVTYKVSGQWAPVRGISFRGSYGTSYRAPALAEQFLGSTSGFISQGYDPCDKDNFPSNPANYSANQTVTAANCSSIGLDVTSFTQNSSVTVYRKGGAETGLSAETSRNWGAGVVIQPPLPASIGNLSLSADYFDIKVENGVSDLSGSTILDRCYGEQNFSTTTGFCRFVERDASNRLTVTSSFINLSEDIVKGWEFNARFSTEIAGGRFVLNGTLTKYTEQSSRLFPEEYLKDANGTFAHPEWVGGLDAIYSTGPVTLRYGVDWVSGDKDGKSYDYFAFDEKTGQVDETLAQSYRDNYYLNTPDYFLHSASVQFDIADSYQFTVGVRNLFNTAPPRISAATTTVGNAPLYSGFDYVGRTWFANASFKF